MNEQTRRRVADLVAAAPPITDEQREAAVRILSLAVKRRPDMPLGIHPRKAPA